MRKCRSKSVELHQPTVLRVRARSFSPTYTFSTNRYNTLPTGTLRYDLNGNLQNDSFHSYDWNAEGLNTDIDSSATSMIYDALGRWVERRNAGTVDAVYGPDGRELVVTIGQSLVAGYVALPAGATALYLSSGQLGNWWHPDWLGTARLYSNPSHVIVGDSAYAPFGEVYNSAPIDSFFTGVAQNVEANDFRNFPARDLHTTEGRWLTPDPAGLAAVDLTNPQTLNRYAYVMNDPLGLVDPSGTDPNYAGYQQGFCPASQASCPVNRAPVVGRPTVPDEMTAGEQYYIDTVVRPGFLGIPPVFVSGGLPTGSTGATIYFGSIGNWLSTNMIHVSGFPAASADPDPSTYDVPVGLDIWKGQQQLWHNTAVIGNAAAAATGAIVAAPIVADAASSLTLARLAVGPGHPWGIHFGVGVGGTWLHWLPDAMDEFGNFSAQITTEAAEAWATRTAWLRIPVPILNPAGVLGTIGKPASNCLTGACYAIGQGWIP